MLFYFTPLLISLLLYWYYLFFIAVVSLPDLNALSFRTICDNNRLFDVSIGYCVTILVRTIISLLIPETLIALIAVKQNKLTNMQTKYKWNDINGVSGLNSALQGYTGPGYNLGEWDEFCYESCSWWKIDCLTCWPAVQRATTVLQMPPQTQTWMKIFLLILYLLQHW